MTQAQQIIRSLGGKWSGRSGVACCPAHKDKRPSLSLTDGSNGRLLLKCYSRCEFIDILSALRNLGVLSGNANRSAYKPLRDADRRAPNVKRSKQAHQVWSDAKPIGVTLAERYALARGITCQLPRTLHYVTLLRAGIRAQNAFPK